MTRFKRLQPIAVLSACLLGIIGSHWDAVASGIQVLATPAGGTCAVQFNGGGSFGGDAANLCWDNTLKNLSLGGNIKFRTATGNVTAPVVVSGTTTVNNSTAVVGTGTAFTAIPVGSSLGVSSNTNIYAVVISVTDDTHLTLANAIGNGTTQTINVQYPAYTVKDGSGSPVGYIGSPANDIGFTGTALGLGPPYGGGYYSNFPIFFGASTFAGNVIEFNDDTTLTTANTNQIFQSFTDTGGAIDTDTITFQSARGSAASRTAVVSGDSLGIPLSIAGFTSPTAVTTGGTLSATVDGTVSAGQVPVRFAFSTMGPARPLTEAVRIDSQQKTSVVGIQSYGTKFTITGCAAGTTVGGATAGSFVSGTTGACTVVITMAGANGMTAANGWSCQASDLTTPANLIAQSASSTTTCTITGTTVTGDLIHFLAVAF